MFDNSGPASNLPVHIQNVATSLKIPLPALIACLKIRHIQMTKNTILYGAYLKLKAAIGIIAQDFVYHDQAVQMVGSEEEFLALIKTHPVRTKTYYNLNFYHPLDLEILVAELSRVREKQIETFKKNVGNQPSVIEIDGEFYFTLLVAARVLGEPFTTVKHWIARYRLIKMWPVGKGRHKWLVKCFDVLALKEKNKFFQQERFRLDEIEEILHIGTEIISTWAKVGQIEITSSPGGQPYILFDQINRCLELAQAYFSQKKTQPPKQDSPNDPKIIDNVDLWLELCRHGKITIDGEEYINLSQAAEILFAKKSVLWAWINRNHLLPYISITVGRRHFLALKKTDVEKLSQTEFFSQRRYRTIEVAHMVGVAQRTVLEWGRSGKIKRTFSPGKQSYIHEDQLPICFKLAEEGHKHDTSKRRKPPLK